MTTEELETVRAEIARIDDRQRERMRLATVLGAATVLFVAAVFYVVGRTSARGAAQ